MHYSIEKDDANSTDLFHIDPDEGVVLLKRSLDHESHRSHHFTVMATDLGVPSLSSTAHVWVTVIDMNDNPPKFEQPSYTCVLSEEAERGQLVGVVSASDPDYVDENLLTYTIVGGNEQQTYHIDQATGLITLINMQNFAEEKLAVLNVSVTDGVYTRFTRVKIEILPANRHNPRFANPLVEAAVMENQPAGKLVTTVKAIDEDFGDYGSVMYTITSEAMKELFSVNKHTGEILTRQPLDREDRRIHQFTVTASDGGGRLGFVTVRVKVTDDNDNSPVFALKEYKATIFGNLTLNAPIIKVTAKDADEEDNSIGSTSLVYSIYEPKNSAAKEVFGIKPDTGLIYLKKSAHQWGEYLAILLLVLLKNNNK